MQQAEGSASMVAVTAAADSRTNTVVVTGPESVLNVVDEVIKKLDSPMANVADVKVFHLEYADASNTVPAYQRGLRAKPAPRLPESLVAVQLAAEASRFSSAGGSGAAMGGDGRHDGRPRAATAAPSSDVTVIASADTRTNSVVVSGPPETLAVIGQIIKDLDENPAAERRIFVYALKNATATSLMTILNNLFQEMQTLNQRVTGTRSTTISGGQERGGCRGRAAGGGMAGGGGRRPPRPRTAAISPKRPTSRPIRTPTPCCA